MSVQYHAQQTVVIFEFPRSLLHWHFAGFFEFPLVSGIKNTATCQCTVAKNTSKCQCTVVKNTSKCQCSNVYSTRHCSQVFWRILYYTDIFLYYTDIFSVVTNTVHVIVVRYSANCIVTVLCICTVYHFTTHYSKVHGELYRKCTVCMYCVPLYYTL